MTAKEFGDSVMKGVSSMMGLVILLVLSFSIGGVIKGMGTGQFLASLLGDSIDGAFCPAIIFLMGALMAFCTGTSWGTFSILSSMSVGTDLYSHVKTQLPYALVTAACTAALYIAFGLIL